MMNYKFNADHIVAEEDGFMEMICFADDEFSPSKSVIIQKTFVNNEGERAVGMDKAHIQVGDESRSSYGGISAVRLISGNLVLSFDHDARQALRIEGDVEIVVDQNHRNFESAMLGLKKICRLDGVEFFQ